MLRSELDLDQAVWTIPGSRTKNGRTTLVPLSPGAVALIREAIMLGDVGQDLPSAFVFPARWDRDKALPPASLTRALRDVCRALSLPPLTPHGAAAVTLSTYALHDFMPEKRSALVKWDKLLSEVVSNSALVQVKPSPDQDPSVGTTMQG